MTVANWLGSGWGLTTMLQSAPTHFTIEPNSAYAFLLGLSVGLLVYSIFVSPVYLSSLKHLPGPKQDNAFFFGQTLKFLHVPWFPNLYLEWSRQWPDAPFIRYLGMANTETLFVNSIVAYKEILQTKAACFVKPKFARTFAHETIGDGLPFAEGQLHKLRRAAMMRTFSVPSLKDSFPMVQEKARQWTDVLSQKKNEAGDVENFNHLETDGSPLYNSFTNAMKPSTFGHIVNYLNSSFPIRKYLPIHELQEAAFHREKARDFIRAHVSARLEALWKDEAANGNAPDALQYLVEHSDSGWGKNEIVEYAIHELSRRPEVQQRLRDEMKSLGHSLENAIHNNINKLPFLHNFVREVLRLYCANGTAAMVPREATCDIDIAGVPIPKGTVIQLSPAVMNLHPSVWGPTAGDFDPDRWDTLSGAAASPYAFETFHNGPRMCVGKQLAIMEMKVMIVELVGRFRIEADGDGPLEIAQPTFTLRPKEKLVVRLVEL
ncbi:cytochrome P450 [Ilyonectria robusta]|uniref:cytochrome P450 n=1 Tax=Ilyonectria robusta TaxID=1079257 RepID=UPI001E8CFAE3|nr:cytochrome P450 [Ilyonectria robusta]KAH8736438.1 cytochrome P450 [Ilyonectria robusta]